jgi:hypothetical protein
MKAEESSRPFHVSWHNNCHTDRNRETSSVVVAVYPAIEHINQRTSIKLKEGMDW